MEKPRDMIIIEKMCDGVGKLTDDERERASELIYLLKAEFKRR